MYKFQFTWYASSKKNPQPCGAFKIMRRATRNSSPLFVLNTSHGRQYVSQTRDLVLPFEGNVVEPIFPRVCTNDQIKHLIKNWTLYREIDVWGRRLKWNEKTIFIHLKSLTLGHQCPTLFGYTPIWSLWPLFAQSLVEQSSVTFSV